MTTEEKKRCLENYRTEQKELKRFAKEYGCMLDLERLIGTGSTKTAKTAQNDIQAEKIRLCKSVSRILKHKRKIEQEIDRLEDGTQALILRYRYIDGLNWEEISEQLNYSFRSVHYMHNKALRDIAI